MKQISLIPVFGLLIIGLVGCASSSNKTNQPSSAPSFVPLANPYANTQDITSNERFGRPHDTITKESERYLAQSTETADYPENYEDDFREKVSPPPSYYIDEANYFIQTAPYDNPTYPYYDYSVNHYYYSSDPWGYPYRESSLYYPRYSTVYVYDSWGGYGPYYDPYYLDALAYHNPFWGYPASYYGYWGYHSGYGSSYWGFHHLAYSWPYRPYRPYYPYWYDHPYYQDYWFDYIHWEGDSNGDGTSPSRRPRPDIQNRQPRPKITTNPDLKPNRDGLDTKAIRTTSAYSSPRDRKEENERARKPQQNIRRWQRPIISSFFQPFSQRNNNQPSPSPYTRDKDIGKTIQTSRNTPTLQNPRVGAPQKQPRVASETTPVYSQPRSQSQTNTQRWIYIPNQGSRNRQIYVSPPDSSRQTNQVRTYPSDQLNSRNSTISVNPPRETRESSPSRFKVTIPSGRQSTPSVPRIHTPEYSPFRSMNINNRRSSLSTRPSSSSSRSYSPSRSSSIRIQIPRTHSVSPSRSRANFSAPSSRSSSPSRSINSPRRSSSISAPRSSSPSRSASPPSRASSPRR